MSANPAVDPQPLTVTVDSKQLGRCLAACMKHYALDDTRPTLNRVRIIMEESHAVFECTNGYTALRYRLPVEGLGTANGQTYQLDRDQVKQAYAILPKSGLFQLTVWPISSSYPELERLIPTPSTSIQFTLKYLTDALAACKGMGYVTLDIKTAREAVTLRAADQSNGGSDVTVLVMPAWKND